MLDILSKIKKISSSFDNDLKKISNVDEFDALKNTYLGRKGLLASLFKDLSELSAEDKKEAGASINTLKKTIDETLKSVNFKKGNEKRSNIDFSLPGTPFTKGRLHPLTIVTNEIKEIFNRIGFSSVFGPL